MKWLAAALLIGLLSMSAAYALTHRYSVSSYQAITVRLDHWTGAELFCLPALGDRAAFCYAYPVNPPDFSKRGVSAP